MKIQPRLLAPASLVLALAALAGPARAAEVETISGQVDEDIVSIAREGDALVLHTSRRSIPAPEVKEVRFAGTREARPAPARVFLTNGDELAGEVTGGDDTKISVRTSSLGDVAVKIERVAAVAWTSDERELRRFRDEVARAETKTDFVVTRGWGHTEGILDHVDEKGVTIDAKSVGGKVTLGMDKALGVRIAPLGKAPAAPAGLEVRLDLADGSQVSGLLVKLEGGVFKIDSLRPGLEVKQSEVRSIAFAGGRFSYLSDMKPAETDEHPDIATTLPHPYQADRNVIVGPQGGPIRLDGKTFRKGLGVHAYSKLVFKLDGKFARFRARVGLDDSAREARTFEGAVKFQVLVDGKPALGEGLRLSTSDQSRPLDIDVTDAKTITLIADFSDDRDMLARGDWADAYLVRK